MLFLTRAVITVSMRFEKDRVHFAGITVGDYDSRRFEEQRASVATIFRSNLAAVRETTSATKHSISI